MEEDNYKLLLDKLDEYEKRVSDMEARISEVTSFNKQLLNTRSLEAPSTPKEERLSKLEEKLKGAFH